MIAVDGENCLFVAVVMQGEEEQNELIRDTLLPSHSRTDYVSEKFIETKEDEGGRLISIDFKDEDKFNFAFDIVDQLGRTKPDKVAMIHVDKNKVERRFTFRDMKRASAQCANYFKSLGIKKGDRVMLVLKRHYQF